MSDALKRLIEAVEAGDAAEFRKANRAAFSTPCQDVALQLREEYSRHAFKGSLDAAKALHDALLPGWNYLVSAHDAEVWHHGVYYESILGHVDSNPARAWLLAVLKAYQQVQA